MYFINRVFIALVVAIATALSMSCSKGEIKSAAPASNENKTSVNANQAPANTKVPTAADNTTSPAAAPATPADAYKAAYQARKSKDVAALKRLFAKDILDFFTMLGNLEEKDKKTLDQMLLELCEKPQAPTAEVRNEKITGDKATAQYLDEKGGWTTMDFVKEDGQWKLSIGKMEEDDNVGPSFKKPAGAKKK